MWCQCIQIRMYASYIATYNYVGSIKNVYAYNKAAIYIAKYNKPSTYGQKIYNFLT